MSTADTFVGTIRGERLPDGLKSVHVNGVNLPYLERGTGQLVVLVHGGISDLTAWEPILGLVARRYRAISYSRRFAWPGEPIPDGVDDQMLPHVDDLIAVVETLGDVRTEGPRAIDAYIRGTADWLYMPAYGSHTWKTPGPHGQGSSSRTAPIGRRQ